MGRLSLPVVIVVAVVIALALTWLAVGRGSYGSDELVAQSRTVPPFKRIAVTGSTSVVLVQDTGGPVVVETPRRGKARVTTEVRGDTLEVTATDRRRWWTMLFQKGSSAPSRVTIHFADLEAIEVAGGVSVSAGEVRVPLLQIEGSGGTTLRIADLRATTLRVAGAGALKADLAGQVTDQAVSISGAGNYQAEKLVSENATVDVSGAGRIVVNATKTLQASISGAGVVEYLGDPKVRERVNGVGRVKRRGAVEVADHHIAMSDPRVGAHRPP
jgi:hypothetical protein